MRRGAVRGIIYLLFKSRRLHESRDHAAAAGPRQPRAEVLRQQPARVQNNIEPAKQSCYLEDTYVLLRMCLEISTHRCPDRATLSTSSMSSATTHAAPRERRYSWV